MWKSAIFSGKTIQENKQNLDNIKTIKNKQQQTNTTVLETCKK
jgi:hypothetical protein